MVLFSLTLPSRFGEWCDAVTARLVERALGPAEVIYADTLEQFTLAMVRSEAPYVVVASRQVVGSLWSALRETNRGVIVALDNPHLALENLTVRHGMDFLMAARIVAKSCASMLSCTPMPRALVLIANQSRANPTATAQKIALHLGLNVSEAAIADIVAGLAHTGLWPTIEEDHSWLSSLESRQRALVAGAINPYLARLGGGDLGQITWERELFYVNEEKSQEQDQAASRAVDVTGRPRFLLHGPYVTLPPGSWSATVALGFSEEAAQLSYSVDIHANTQLAEARIEPSGRDAVEVDLNFSISEPVMIDVRVRNERAAFDGRMALGHVIMTPHISMRPETKSYFATALTE